MNANERLETLWALRDLWSAMDTANAEKAYTEEFYAVGAALEDFGALIEKAATVYAW
jgi:hypothetical protein